MQHHEIRSFMFLLSFKILLLFVADNIHYKYVK